MCPPLFTINGNPSSNTIFLQSAEPRNFIISCAGIGHPIQVVPQTEEVKSELQIDLDIVEPRHICEDLLCEGMITLDVQGARGNHSVQWFKDGVLWCEYSGSQPMGGGVGTNCQTEYIGLVFGQLFRHRD